MFKSRFALRIAAILLCFSILGCQKKKEEEKDNQAQGGEGAQVEQPVPTTTTSTTLPSSTSTTSTTMPSVTTTTSSSTTTTTTSTTTTTTLPADVIKDISQVIGGQVDKIYPDTPELLVQRGSGYVHKTDECDSNVKSQGTFAAQISYYVNKNMSARKAQLSEIASLYDIPTSRDQLVATSLISHAMCEVTEESLKKTIGASRLPGAKVIAQAQSFAKKYNELRAKMRSGDKDANLEMNRLWSRMNMCLAYVEALTTADTSTSEKLAQKYAPSDYRRPAGVLFYEDAGQSDVSKLNLGLFQFSPDSGGNIHTCIKQWNNIYPGCQIPSAGSSADMIRLLGSSYQAFNSYCGTEKPTETFAVQVNTTNSKRTHPQNQNADGSLKAPADRCVTLHFQAGVAYNHFGPFQNTTGNNLGELLACTMAQ